MKICLLLSAIMISVAVHSQTIYVVRHGEKAVVPADASPKEKSDPALSEAGVQRATRLTGLLKDQNVIQVWSTPYKRTQSTVEGVAAHYNLSVQTYSPRNDSTLAMVNRLKALSSGTVVIAGHSNTVDDIVNAITGEASIPGDLDESEYDNLFVLRKEGGKFVLERRKY